VCQLATSRLAPSAQACAGGGNAISWAPLADTKQTVGCKQMRAATAAALVVPQTLAHAHCTRCGRARAHNCGALVEPPPGLPLLGRADTLLIRRRRPRRRSAGEMERRASGGEGTAAAAEALRLQRTQSFNAFLQRQQAAAAKRLRHAAAGGEDSGSGSAQAAAATGNEDAAAGGGRTAVVQAAPLSKQAEAEFLLRQQALLSRRQRR
jgi:hypothetical protein